MEMSNMVLTKWIGLLEGLAKGCRMQRKCGGRWVDMPNVPFPSPDQFRLLDPPSYEPFSSMDALADEFCSRFGVKRTEFGYPFIWITSPLDNRVGQVLSCRVDGANVWFDVGGYGQESSSVLLDRWTFLDGSPCGRAVWREA